MRPIRLCILLVILISSYGTVVHAESAFPPSWNIVADDFESRTLEAWKKVSAGNLRLVPGGGHYGSTGLSVVVGQYESHLYQTDLTYAQEGYLTFWLNPTSASIPDRGSSWIPGRSICVANVKGPEQWSALVALRVYNAGGQGYKAYLEWHGEDGTHYDYGSGEFALTAGWQKITLGFQVDEWVAVWLNDVLVRQVSGVTHEEVYGEIIEIGQTNATPTINPTGTLYYDEVIYQIPRIDDLWVDVIHGDNARDGLTPATTFRTIQKAADIAGPGTTVHILPGIYRETVWPAMNGSAAEPVTYIAEQGPGTAIVRGSEPAASLTWTQLTANTLGLPPGVDPTNIYYTDLSAWKLNGPPRFVAELDDSGGVIARLPLAREPDWRVVTEWKTHEFWWAADGGSDVAGCDPPNNPDPRNCDFAWRSTTQLTDRTNDTAPAGIEAGNLTTLGNLTGATLVAMDTRQGHYVYRRTIVAHDVPAGRVTVDRPCEHDSGTDEPGLGWGSKYYVEGKPYLLDTPGEWWYDTGSGRLYLWPPEGENPATMNVEISRRDNGFSLKNRSHVVLDGLSIEFLNASAVYQVNSYTEKSYGNTVRNVTLRYANRGLLLEQSVRATAPAANITDGFTLENSEIAYMDTSGIHLSDWWDNNAAPDSFTHSGVLNTVIRNNELHHLGFRTERDSATGVVFQFAHHLHFEHNYVHDVAHNGVQFSNSVIQSPKTYAFAPDEIKTGEILIQDNVFEQTCQLSTDCGGLKLWGSPPDKHVFRDVLITGNTFRNIFGWTYVSEKRRYWTGGASSNVRGMGGFGLYVDMASGIHAYRNVAYNNAYAGFMLSGIWQDGDMVYYNNIAADSLYGFLLSRSNFDTHDSINTQVVNNVLANNEGYGILQNDMDGRYDHITIDHNLYYSNGWRTYENGGMWKAGAMAIYCGACSDEYYPTLADIRADTDWESHGVAGTPGFWDYNPADHDPHDGSWPDFHLTPASVNALDRGTNTLPASLQALLGTFGVYDPRLGTAFDIGRYEGGFVILSTPSVRSVNPGGVAQYVLYLYPSDSPYIVALTVASPSPSLVVTLSPTLIGSTRTATLTVTDTHTVPTLMPGLWYTVPITGYGGGFTRTAGVSLMVGGRRVYLPLTTRGH